MIKTKGFIIFILFYFVAITLTSCYKDHEEILYPVSSGSSNDCSNPDIEKGVKFLVVESIIQSKCVSCHSVSGGTSPDLSTPCSIVNNWSAINIECVVDKSMPTSGPLSTSYQQAITDWVNTGHSYTN